ncbi:hypothetical protein CHUAL_004061 [Chamberlinius hualienensis]
MHVNINKVYGSEYFESQIMTSERCNKLDCKNSYNVGAGSAGSVVAGRLSEDLSIKVLLLEAGEYPPPESEIPAEFNACLTWPLTVSEPPFPQTESFKLFLKSSEAQEYKMIDVNGQSQVVGFTMREGSRCSTFIAYLQPALDRNNLKILTQAQVIKIILDGNKRAVGVTFSRNGSEYNVTAKKEVIISAGAIQSPQILMLSGIGPADHLKQFKIPVVVDLPGVGSNFQDHVVKTAPSWSSVNLQNISSADPTSNKSLTEWLYFRRGPRIYYKKSYLLQKILIEIDQIFK